MSPLALFVRTVMKTSAICIGATWVVMHPTLDWSASRATSLTAQPGPNGAAVQGLVAALGDEDGNVRREAAAALDRIRTAQGRSVRELTDDLSAADPAIRARAACDVKETGPKAAELIEPLVALLGDGAPVDPAVCGRKAWRGSLTHPTSPGEQAAGALVSIGAPAFQPVLAALKGTSWIARRNAAWALGAFDDRRAVGPLAQALKDQEAGVRRQAAWALGAIDDSTVVPALIATLDDKDAGVRQQVAWALGALGDERAVPALGKALGDGDAEVREQAAWALGAIGDRRGVPALVGALRDEKSDVREQAAWALGAIGDSSAAQALLPLLKDPEVGVRRQAAWAIGAIGR